MFVLILKSKTKGINHTIVAYSYMIIKLEHRYTIFSVYLYGTYWLTDPVVVSWLSFEGEGYKLNTTYIIIFQPDSLWWLSITVNFLHTLYGIYYIVFRRAEKFLNSLSILFSLLGIQSNRLRLHYFSRLI